MPWIAGLWDILPKVVIDNKTLCRLKTSIAVLRVEKTTWDYKSRNRVYCSESHKLKRVPKGSTIPAPSQAKRDFFSFTLLQFWPLLQMRCWANIRIMCYCIPFHSKYEMEDSIKSTNSKSWLKISLLIRRILKQYAAHCLVQKESTNGVV